MTPMLKWAGGKTQLLDRIIARMPNTYNDYYEPFIGGGSVLLAMAPKRAVIGDINEQLINLYTQIRDKVEDIIFFVNKLDSRECDKEFYYSIRQRYNEKIMFHILDAECAALMIWVNKHCFNGLYRVNKEGLFNVPYNQKHTGKSIDENNLRSISEYLNNAEIMIKQGDFENVCCDVKAGDFVYFDSPYVPKTDTADFTHYAKGGFSFEDHERLAKLFYRLDKIGALCMISNNDVPLAHELYKGFNIESFDVKRMINRDASKRMGREVLITNY